MSATTVETNGTTTKKTIRTASVPNETPAQITLKRIERRSVEVPIVGITPLIMHNWSHKSKDLMLKNQQVKKAGTKAVKEPRDPEADYQASFYRLEDGTPGMPATAFKAAIAEAARFFDGVTMTSLKSAIQVRGIGSEQLVPIIGEHRMRTDTPRNASGVADLRFRPEFWPWQATLHIIFIESLIDLDSIWALVDAAGSNGVGDWRPSSPKSKTGTFGQWEVTA